MNFYKSLAFLSLQKILVFYLVFSVPSKPIFVSDLFKLGQIIFSNVKDSFRNDNKFVKLCYLVYFNAGLVRNLRHMNVLFQLSGQLFQENLGTCRLAKK